MFDACTPIQEIAIIEDNRIFIKRDDLYPFFFGGNKVRIAEEFFLDMKTKRKNCIIGYGNSRSNMSRAIANMAYARRIPCYIISPNDDDGTRIETTNSKIVNECQAIIRLCNKNTVSQTVEKVFEECISMGYDPYYIYGDCHGKGNETVPLRAYEKVYKEIAEQSKQSYDYIFLATGTGMTQAGLLCGKTQYHGTEKIVGISIARKTEIEERIIRSYLQANHYVDETDVIVDDSYIGEGYGKFGKEITKTIKELYKEQGIPLDPVYTGKAYYGMIKWLKTNQIRGKRVLFIHTGGTPLFFDFINLNYSTIEKCTDKKELIEFLKQIDNELPTPLSLRVDLIEYASRVLKYGNAFVMRMNNDIIAGGLFYCNDYETKQGYLTLLVSKVKGKGCGSIIMEEVERVTKNAGMEYLVLETENNNSKAIDFYKKRGYEVIAIEKKTKMMKKV